MNVYIGYRFILFRYISASLFFKVLYRSGNQSQICLLNVAKRLVLDELTSLSTSFLARRVHGLCSELSTPNFRSIFNKIIYKPEKYAMSQECPLQDGHSSL